MRDILKSFVTALDAEIAIVEKESREGVYELIAGRRDEKATGALYVFILADTLRLPEDASGTLKIGPIDARASVVALEGNKVWLNVESLVELPASISSARLVINETELLLRLKEKIELLDAGDDLGLTAKAFGREPAVVGSHDLPLPFERKIEGEGTRAALRHSLGSEVTFLWGPPGTGKTYSIAALVAMLATSGETTLVTSHTHAAVEQALYALIEPAGDGRPAGLLAEASVVEEGRILKVGQLRSSKIPRSVHLDSYLEDRAAERETNAAVLVAEQARIDDELRQIDHVLAPWVLLRETEGAHLRAVGRLEEATGIHAVNTKAMNEQRSVLTAAEAGLSRQRSSFFVGRAGRVQRAENLIRSETSILTHRQAAAGESNARVVERRLVAEETSRRVVTARAAVAHLEEPTTLEQRRADLTERRETLAEQVRALREPEAEDPNELLENALAIFATLTKIYTDRTKLSELRWDNVIIDEASMAMMPLVAFAASRARKRLIIAGDMYQLPPIVHSPPGSAGALLGEDIFEFRGISAAVDANVEQPILAKLSVQRRMHPTIADVARELISGYRDLTDDRSTGTRSKPTWMNVFPTSSPLAIVDIAGFRSWSGKVPGSLSRFNLVSAQAAVEIAALYATGLPKPADDSAPRIGIVTPYAAQRRYLTKLIETLNLQSWVAAGTVHTFQGNECDVIIFDSVLSEPHWTARLTDPHQFEAVRRDINVAVTRARHQFVFVGDSAWLKKNAKPDSGYGRLWNHLAGAATQVPAESILGEGFRERIGRGAAPTHAWSSELPRHASFYTEATFYDAFVRDLREAKQRVILYTPFIGKTRWPLIEPHIAALRSRNVEVYLLHKPLSDRDWRQGDPEFGRAVFTSLEALGVRLIPLSGVHAKTIVIDSHIVYDGSLNWASQTNSYEHMWRMASKDMALLVEKMLQIEPLVASYGSAMPGAAQCPTCDGPLILINQTQQTRGDAYPVKLGCFNRAENKQDCSGYLRRVDGRPPFKTPPKCAGGAKMRITYSKTGKPWAWQCHHRSCSRPVRWARGDCER